MIEGIIYFLKFMILYFLVLIFLKYYCELLVGGIWSNNIVVFMLLYLNVIIWKIENDVKIVCLIKFFRGNVDFFCVGWYIEMNVFFNLKNNYVFLIDVYEINKLDCDERFF